MRRLTRWTAWLALCALLLTAAAAGAVTATGLLQSGLATDIDGASITFAAINAGSAMARKFCSSGKAIATKLPITIGASRA